MRVATSPLPMCLLLLCAVLLICPSCGDGDGDHPPGGPGGAFTAVEIEPSPGFSERQAAYLDHCNRNNGPGQEGRHGQVCRAYTAAGSYNEESIYGMLDKINERQDTSDFDLNTLLRVLQFDRVLPSLPAPLRQAIEETVLGFKYWLDEPGPDDMVWWSENHQILFHTAELLAGQLYPDRVFENSGMTGTDHVAHAIPELHRWLDFRGRFGFCEFHSNVYFNEDMPALLNLVDFAGEEAIRVKAAMVLDIIAFDMACNYYKGQFATTHGRTYPGELLEGLSDSTREAAYILLGREEPESVDQLSTGNFTGAFLATSDHYRPPPLLEAIGEDARLSFEHRQRDGITVEEGPGYGIGYETDQDVMFWWGMTGYVAPDIITGSLNMIDAHDMWEGNIWKDLSFLRFFVGSSLPVTVSRALEPMSRGVVLEAVDTYTYRTPYYQLSGAQDYKPGSWTGQVHIWQATIDAGAYVFTTYPGGMKDDYMGGDWTGGFIPRATFHENVGVIQYRRPSIPLMDLLLFVDYSHACFPREGFDEIVEDGNWVLGRKGDAYVGLYSQHAPVWSEENTYELIADARENVWIVELGSIEESGTFQDFVEGLTAAAVTIGDTVTYDSPSQGRVEVGWTGPATVRGNALDLGPFNRWDNVYCHQKFGGNRTQINFDGRRLDLDFEAATRTLWTRTP